MSLFVDTSAFYALLVKTESEHSAIKDAFGEAAERGRRLLTTSYVVIETSALLQHRIGLPPVRDLSSKILPLVQIVFIDGHIHERGLERLFQIDRRQVSLVDAVSFVAMEAEGVTDVLGLDPDFAIQGFRLRP